MELCGIDADTPDPDGGQIVRDGDGNPIGVFRETASGLLGAAHARARRPDPRLQADMAQAECLAKGVTSFQDAGSSFRQAQLFRQMADEGALHVRLWVMLREANDRLERQLPQARLVDHADHHLTVRAIKRSLDGALGSHGAWLLEPYADLPGSEGLNTLPLDDLARTAELALEHDVQLCVHAIGDRANREVLDLYERAWKARDIDGSTLRWRIEHAQHLHPDDVPRFGALGVIASMQGVHCTSDAPWVYARLGSARAGSGAYMWRDLLNSGALVINGTDAPVEDVDPIASFYATVARRLPDDSVFFPRQRLTRLEALRSYTLSAAEAAFEEEHKGSLSLGKLGDVVVLSRDILDCPEDQIPGARVLYTIVGGEVLYDAGDR
jgi:predicted amidohydrolase YtcJ